MSLIVMGFGSGNFFGSWDDYVIIDNVCNDNFCNNMIHQLGLFIHKLPAPIKWVLGWATRKEVLKYFEQLFFINLINIIQ